MARFVRLYTPDEKPLLLNVDEISSVRSEGEVDGPSVVTLRDGREFVVRETVYAIEYGVKAED